MSNEVSLEKKVVAAALASRSAFFRIDAASSIEDSYTPYSSLLLKLAHKFYNRDDNAAKVDLDVLVEWIRTSLPAKNQEIYINHLKECAGLDVSAINVADVVVEARRKHLGNQLAASLLENKNPSKINELVESYTAIADTNEEVAEEDYNNVSVGSVVEDISNKEGLIKLLPEQLDRVCKGKTKRGHHIVIFARPETGKTAISLTIAYATCQQKLTTIIFGNEEPVRDTILRAQCCFTGMTEEEIVASPAKAQALLDSSGWKYLRFIPLSPGSPKEIDKYIARYKADVAIVDQIRNLNVGAETRVNQLEMAATSMRNIGKRRDCLMISVTQAGDSANNKLVLDMGDVDFSNTGIPATADLMIGMGINKEHEAQGLRMINTPKNKIGAVHMNFLVRINTALSRLEDL